MGTFRVGFEIGDSAGSWCEPLEALVDTGATYTWVPRGVLARLGLLHRPRLQAAVGVYQQAVGRDERQAPPSSIKKAARQRS